MIQELKVRAMQDVSDIVCTLIKNNYICESKSIYKKFPEENSIDYFQISYWKDGEKEE